MNAEQAARLLGVSAKTVHRHIARGTITATYKHAQELSISDDQVEKLRQVLASDMSRPSTDSSQAVLSRLSSVEQKLAALEQEVATLHQAMHMQPPAPTKTIKAVAEKPQKRTYKPRETGLPEGCVLATDFAKMHGVEPRMFYDHMVLGLGPGTVPGEQGDPMLPVKEQLDYSERDKPGRKGERERYLTPAQQTAALDFWKRHGVAFTVPESEQDAPADESWWTEPGAE